MAKIIPILLYLQAAWSTLVVPCVTNPDNWQRCFSDWDDWLYPELVRGFNLYTGSEVPYAEESGILSGSPNETK